MEQLLTVVNPGLLLTFVSLVNKRFKQPLTEALPKRLLSGSVHAGQFVDLNLSTRTPPTLAKCQIFFYNFAF